MPIAEDPQELLGSPAVLLTRLDDQRLSGVARSVRAQMRGTAAVRQNSAAARTMARQRRTDVERPLVAEWQEVSQS
jgi:hypothetical protein